MSDRPEVSTPGQSRQCRRRIREGLSLRHALEGEVEHHPNMPHRVLDAIVRPVTHRRLHRLKDVPRQQRDRYIPANLSVLRRRLEQTGHLHEYRGGGARPRAQQRAVPYREAVDEPGELFLFQHPADRSFDHDNDLLFGRLRASQTRGVRGRGFGFGAKEALEQFGQDLLPFREVLVEGWLVTRLPPMGGTPSDNSADRSGVDA